MRKLLMWFLRNDIREMIDDRLEREKQIIISHYNVAKAFDNFMSEKFMSFNMGALSYLDGLGSDVTSQIRRIAIDQAKRELLEFDKEEFLDKIIERINSKQLQK